MQREFLPHIFGTSGGTQAPAGPSQTSASEIQMRSLSEKLKNLDRIVIDNDTRVEKMYEKIKSWETESRKEMDSLRMLKGEVEGTFRHLATTTETRYATLEGRLSRLTEMLKESMVREEEMRRLMDRAQSVVTASENRMRQMKSILDKKEAELLATRSLVGEMRAEIEKLKRF